RVLETGEFIKVGSSNIQKTNVRIVAATNMKMAKAVSENKFREDLYYRLNTVEISLPPLRERKSDIHLLFRKFAIDFAEKYRMPVLRLDPDAVAMVENFKWPGNIRQLRNFVEQISVVEKSRSITPEVLLHYLPNQSLQNLPSTTPDSENDADFASERALMFNAIFELKSEIGDLKKLTLEFLKENQNITFYEKNHALINKLFKDEHPRNEDPNSTALVPVPNSLPAVSNFNGDNNDTFFNENEHIIDIEESGSLSLLEKELEMIKKALERNNGKRKDAATELGISERTLYRKIKQFDL
ncbi:MAG: sigma-54-dependent Fis family transcriptional regulator, partial [Flavobacteriales bacterium]|nr:sigma-54-dependent Fis family transcriptional regulator [Flavobacteriales bacterium]